MATANYTPSMGDMDLIFCGGGTSACVCASRLAAANPSLRILLIEQGPNNHSNPTITTPAMYLSHLLPTSRTALFYKSLPSTHLNGREAIVPMGGVLGGGSSINFMMYTRAQGADFDSWKTPGWERAEMEPLCKKLEHFHQDEPGIDKSKHGYDGPIHVSDGGFRSNFEKEFMNTVKKMGHEEIVDLQDWDQVGGFSRWQRYVSPDGKRQDAAHRYLHPLLEDGKHTNLHVLTDARVARVLFDETSNPPRAIGVEYVRNAEAAPESGLANGAEGARMVVKASKMVVVAAGALGTPQVLERSGVGAKEVLEKVGVKCVVDLEGVGENYQDHHLLLYPYKTSLPEGETLDALLSGRREWARAMEEGDGILGWNGIDVCAKLRMTDKEVASLGPEFQKDWERDFVPFPTRPVMLCGVVNAFLADPTLVPPGQYITLGTYTAYPYSRGSIHITSTSDLSNGYAFDAGFLNHPSDIKKQLWAYKLTREIARRLPCFRGELELGHPKFGVGSGAGLFDEKKEGEDGGGDGGEVKDVVYSKEDDAAIEEWIRGNLNTTWHSLGTCAMRPRAEGGVVDGDLNVYGTVGLKVCDLSMVPENVGGNTNNTALVVGEKAAVIIGRELGVEV